MQRFWSKVDPNGPLIVVELGPCWVWTAATFAPGSGGGTAGYGVFHLEDNSIVRAHRFSYETFVGPIPDGELVLHHCDHPPCIRPDHLFTGDHLVNAADRDQKGRWAGGRPPG